MSFTEFRNCNFYKLGKLRYDYIDNDFKVREVAIYDTFPITPLMQEDSYILEDTFERTNELKRQLTLVHMRRALEVGNNYTPSNLRKIIGQQWIDVNNVISRIPVKPQSSMLIIQEPGSVVTRHLHRCKQVLTLSFRYDEDRVFKYKESYLSLGETDNDISTIYPQSDRFYFSLYDEVLHESKSNEWRFFYFHEYLEYVDVPNDISFTKWVPQHPK